MGQRPGQTEEPERLSKEVSHHQVRREDATAGVKTSFHEASNLGLDHIYARVCVCIPTR